MDGEPMSVLDYKSWRNPKLVEAGTTARGMYFAAVSWSAEHLTNGRVPTHALAQITPDLTPKARKTAADALVRVGCFTTAQDAVVIHDFRDYNFEPDEVKARQAERQASAVRGYVKASETRRNGRFAGAHAQEAVTIDRSAHAHAQEAVPSAVESDRFAHAGAPGAVEIDRSPTAPENVDRRTENEDVGLVGSAGAHVELSDDAADFFPDGYGEEPQVMPDYEAPPPNPIVAPDQAPAAKPKRRSRPASADDLAELQRFWGKEFGAAGLGDPFRECWQRLMAAVPNAGASYLNDALSSDYDRLKAKALPATTTDSHYGDLMRRKTEQRRMAS